jgi:hypothetical protein
MVTPPLCLPIPPSNNLKIKKTQKMVPSKHYTDLHTHTPTHLPLPLAPPHRFVCAVFFRFVSSTRVRAACTQHHTTPFMPAHPSIQQSKNQKNTKKWSPPSIIQTCTHTHTHTHTPTHLPLSPRAAAPLCVCGFFRFVSSTRSTTPHPFPSVQQSQTNIT